MASRGLSLDDTTNWNTIEHGAFRRFPIGVRKVGRIASSGQPGNVSAISGNTDWIADRAWVKKEHIASFVGHPIKDLPFAEVTPEWSNEKGVGAALAFRMLGFDSYHCVHAPVQGSKKVRDFLYGDTRELLGSCMNRVWFEFPAKDDDHCVKYAGLYME